MLHLLKRYLLTQRPDPLVQRKIDLDNMAFCRMLSIMVIFFESYMLLRFGLFGNKADSFYLLRTVSYFAFLTCSILWFFLSGYAKKHMRSHAAMLAVGLGYAALAVMWSMVISVVDYVNGGQVLVFLTIIITVSGFAFLAPVISSLFFTACFAAFYLVLLRADGAAHIEMTNYVIIWLMVIFTSIARYHTKLSDTKARLEYRQLNRKLRKLSLYDELTRVKNRHCLSLDLQSFVDRELFLMLVDVDGFKQLNDRYGHNRGDNVLQQFALILQDHFYTQNVYRYGGDEFIVAVCSCAKAVLLEKIEQCRADMAALRIGTGDEGLSFSGGYAFATIQNQSEFDALLASVDEALYRSKKNGRNQVSGAVWPA